MLVLEVSDDGAGVDLATLDAAGGTGLRRLRERLHWLYGEAAQLHLASTQGGGFRASLHVPASGSAEAAASIDHDHDD